MISRVAQAMWSAFVGIFALGVFCVLLAVWMLGAGARVFWRMQSRPRRV
jgi:hypothetical protein